MYNLLIDITRNYQNFKQIRNNGSSNPFFF